MWTTFFLACAVLALFLFIPAFFLKALRCPWINAVACAPLLSISAYCVLGILFQKTGILCNWLFLFVPVAAISLAAFAAAHFAKKSQSEAMSNIGAIALYAGCGLALGLFFFVKPLDGPDCFTQMYDDLTHLGLIRSFVESGNYSTLATTMSSGWDGAAPSYYPAGWHVVSAMLVSALGTSVTLSSNVSCFITACLVYPLSTLALLNSLFPNNKPAVRSGAILGLATISFPWYFLIYGKLDSNLLGFALVPSVISCAIALSKSQQKTEKALFLCLLLIGFASCFFTQPNAFFTIACFLIAFFVHYIWSEKKEKQPATKRSALVILSIFAFCTFWVFSLNMPLMKGIVDFYWPARSTIIQAIADVFLFSCSGLPAQPILSILFIAGVVYVLKNRNYLWLTIPCLFASISFILCSGCNNSLAESFFAGFWYTDPYRIAAMLSIFEVPLLCLGASTLWDGLASALRNNTDPLFGNVLKVSATIITVLLIFLPSFTIRGTGDVQTAFSVFKQRVASMYSQTEDQIIFSPNEREFTKKAAKITQGDLVINSPFDGSMFAYQAYGMNTMFRSARTPATTESENIRLDLSNYEANSSTRQAVNSTGAKYVLQLDAGHAPFTTNWPYHNTDWVGIDSVNDSSAGFKLVLSDQDMKLYRIQPQ